MNNQFKRPKSASDRRYDRGRKPYSPSYSTPIFKSGDNKPVTKVKKRSNQDNEQLLSLISDSLKEFKEVLNGMAESQNRRAEAEGRKADALEMIAASLGKIGDNGFPMGAARTAPAPAEPEPAPPAPRQPIRNVDRNQVLSIIGEMRGKGATYHEIAQRLEDDNIATFSGKGKWHAQTIHRLCQTEELASGRSRKK